MLSSTALFPSLPLLSSCCPQYSPYLSDQPASQTLLPSHCPPYPTPSIRPASHCFHPVVLNTHLISQSSQPAIVVILLSSILTSSLSPASQPLLSSRCPPYPPPSLSLQASNCYHPIVLNTHLHLSDQPDTVIFLLFSLFASISQFASQQLLSSCCPPYQHPSLRPASHCYHPVVHPTRPQISYQPARHCCPPVVLLSQNYLSVQPASHL